jgi:hypothetical protein
MSALGQKRTLSYRPWRPGGVVPPTPYSPDITASGYYSLRSIFTFADPELLW